MLGDAVESLVKDIRDAFLVGGCNMWYLLEGRCTNAMLTSARAMSRPCMWTDASAGEGHCTLIT